LPRLNPMSSAKAGRFDRGMALWQGARPNARAPPAPNDISTGDKTLMVKPEWGTKRTCPKCSTRFYDLGQDDPVHCINCGTDWLPEPVLKSKQPLAFEAVAPVQKEPVEDEELAADDLAIDEDAEVSADEEVDLETGDDDLGVETAAEDDEV
jgi:uncharacterized protein (TIGR02300 family)